MTTTCPVCDKSVDPLRSRFVGVIGGKVVAYCSEACAHKIEAVAEAARSISPASGVPTPIPAPPAVSPARVELASDAGPPRPVTPAPGVPVSLESGPVIEIIREPGSAAVAPAGDAEPARHPDELPSAARSSAGSEAAGSADEDAAREAPRTSRWGLVLVVVLLLGVAAFLGVRALLAPGRTEPAPPPAAAAAPAELRAPPRPPEPPVVEPAAAVERARGVLLRHLAATSPRVQRLAAAALARTQDPAALDVLAAQLGLAPKTAGAGSAAPELETSEIAKLDLAYALARGGDKRGGAALVAGAASQRAEVRAEAARLLALLRDPRAVPHLSALLGVSQRRLGAAEHLAHLADPRAIKVLEQIRGDAKASADDKARATIALGVARHAEVAPALRDMLSDAHFNAFAAAALAELEDGAARPVLEQQLDSPSLRVGAARALRRLDPALDPRPALPRLLDALGSGRDTEQILAAEAVLVLAGPERWSAYD